MSETFRCDDKDMLVAYLYGEIDPDGRREVERHLRTCVACARETDALQGVRENLATWQPLVPELGFEILPKPASVVRPGRWGSPTTLPGWAQAAAAVLVVAAGAALANLQIQYGSDGLTIRTGWMTPVTQTTSAPVVAPAGDDWRPALAALEQSLRQEWESRQAGGPVAVRTRAADVPADTAAVLRQVQSLVNASESRQRDEMARRLAQTYRDWDMQRRGDMVRIEQRIGTLQGRTFKAEAGQQEVMNLLRRVSAQPIP
jgi:anti-sigma factor RsiW